jgi:hypothetical protein
MLDMSALMVTLAKRQESRTSPMHSQTNNRRWTAGFCSLLLAGTVGVGSVVAPGARAATVMGAGVALSCGGWVETRKGSEPNKSAAEQWVLGYLSAVAMFTNTSPLDGLDPGAVFVWLDNACQQRPLERLPAALVQFVRARAEAAKAQGQRTPPKPQPAPSPKPKQEAPASSNRR